MVRSGARLSLRPDPRGPAGRRDHRDVPGRDIGERALPRRVRAHRLYPPARRRRRPGLPARPGPGRGRAGPCRGDPGDRPQTRGERRRGSASAATTARGGASDGPSGCSGSGGGSSAVRGEPNRAPRSVLVLFLSHGIGRHADAHNHEGASAGRRMRRHTAGALLERIGADVGTALALDVKDGAIVAVPVPEAPASLADATRWPSFWSVPSICPKSMTVSRDRSMAIRSAAVDEIAVRVASLIDPAPAS